jgi:hypothetical protein
MLQSLPKGFSNKQLIMNDVNALQIWAWTTLGHGAMRQTDEQPQPQDFPCWDHHSIALKLPNPIKR